MIAQLRPHNRERDGGATSLAGPCRAEPDVLGHSTGLHAGMTAMGT